MLSIALKNSILKLTISALIAGVESQATCTSTSPDCCWVIRSWQWMEKSTNVSPNSSTACCSMEGVDCSGHFVTKIDWKDKGLVGSIPREIGNLKNLREL